MIGGAALTALLVGGGAGYGGALLAGRTSEQGVAAPPGGTQTSAVSQSPVPTTGGSSSPRPGNAPPSGRNTVEVANAVLPGTVMIQAREYTRIGFGPSDNAFASTFFGLTGLHGAHVFIGLNLLLYALIRSLRGHYGPKAEDHLGVELPGIYWHFVDVMWIVVYTTVYVI